ncbi:MAG: 3-methyl-2-oxobutanoate dehydrogenase subunit VorB [Bacillota bacterium]|nr:3-methyl-2-oxobutanoate dehydrogenase subunit VorB [Bacillota bacterium]
MKGNEAIAEAAIRAGCRFYAGYPITPQNELCEYMARRMPEAGGTFIQSESEIAAINMVYGAGSAGARAMTSSSSPGISLKQEGISYLAGAEVPGVIVNMVRGGPGLGSIQPAQSDYFQATRGGGHGDYRTIVLGPGGIQEAVELTMLAFDLADRYRNPVVVLGDGMMGQMMEPVRFPEGPPPSLSPKPWATTGTPGRDRPNIINSLYIEAEACERHNQHLLQKYREMELREVRYELVDPEAEYFLVAYGTSSRICRAAMARAVADGLRVGMVRPITLWPFPRAAIERVVGRARAFLTVEMSAGQMVEDVRLAVEGRRPVYFFGRTGGAVPTPQEVMDCLKMIREGRGGEW